MEFWRSKRLDPVLSTMYELRPADNIPAVENLNDNIIPIGRLACRDRKMLTHDAYRIVNDKIGEKS
jgi:hypothetical protein